MLDGTCLCGACRFTVDGPVTAASACHCSQCRKTSGHVWASARAPQDAVRIEGPVSWYASSAAAERGFCPRCGASMFWRAHGEDHVSFALGCIDGPTGLRLEKHIFCADKGDYYDIADGVPRFV
ncbi:GFA family protein [Pseudooceanicola sp. LIPI14-2-Ac024]|uniref:GFA family protein n=1 Tax=Pseudooceanicola sp. LIPI14-2-Ac024 TaxID=3344875 RepID=UPI0035D0140C